MKKIRFSLEDYDEALRDNTLMLYEKNYRIGDKVEIEKYNADTYSIESSEECLITDIEYVKFQNLPYVRLTLARMGHRFNP